MGGYPFKIYCTQPYACGNAKDKLRIYFNGGSASQPIKPTIEDYALIYFPYYEGYKLQEVNVTIDENLLSKSIVKLAIANPDNLEASHAGSNGIKATKFSSEEMENEMGTDTSKECCLYMHFNGVSPLTTNCNCFINNISINYILE